MSEDTDAIRMRCRLFRKAVQQGRSEVHGAKKMSAALVDAGESVSRPCLEREA